TVKKPKPPTNDPTSLATKVKPITPDDYVRLGTTMEQNGDIEGAREAFHKALAMQPHHLGALRGLGHLFDRQGQLERATEHYVEATQHHPKDAAAFNDLALCLARQGSYDQAAAACRHAIELKPDSMLYRNNIATILVAQGRNDEALAHLIDAHGPATAHYNLGYLLDKQGRRELAIEQFQLALTADPGMDQAREYIDALTGSPEPPERPAPAGPAAVADSAGPSAPATPRITRRPPHETTADTHANARDDASGLAGSQLPAETLPPGTSSRATSRRRTAVERPPSADTDGRANAPASIEPDAMQPLPPVDASSVHPTRY
ncbi:MAG TPA: tetratricopeptide repeat protein, partial [Pirellulales bacterium]|nr:tetratricopeptide repeat protein [Pirellulales bacterium]